MLTLYYCWLCDKQVDGRLSDWHYESNRIIYFCCLKHKDVHRYIANL